jgi:hypothetical protein
LNEIVASVLSAVFGYLIGLLPGKVASVSDVKMKLERELVENYRGFLVNLAMEYYKKYVGKGERIRFLKVNGLEIPLIVPEGWMLERPVELSDVKLVWDDEVPRLEWRWDGFADFLRSIGKRIINNPIYRLVDIGVDGERLRLNFTSGWYEDYIETCEALVWELAREVVRKRRYSLWWEMFKHWRGVFPYKTFLRRKILDFDFEEFMDLRYRSMVGLTDFRSRCAAVGINTLTVISLRDVGKSARFNLGNRLMMFIHHRGRDVAEAAGMVHVIPAGIFQPLSRFDSYRHLEFSMERNVMREFGEELLDKEVYIGLEGANHPNAPFEKDVELKRLYSLFRKKAVKLFFFGVGIDPLTTKPEVLTLALVDGDALFAKIPRLKSYVEANWEGRNVSQVPFTRENIEGLIRENLIRKPEMLPAGAGCLALAYKYFDEIMRFVVH